MGKFAIVLAFMGISYFGNWFQHSVRIALDRGLDEQLKREEVIANAASWVGVREVGGNNMGKEVESFLSCCGLPGGYPWCGGYVCYVFTQSKLKSPKGACGSYNWAVDSLSVYRYAGIRKKIQAGDIFTLYYRRLGRVGHVGIVGGLIGRNTIMTYEGNTNEGGSRTGDGVYRKARPINSLEGIYNHISYQVK